MPKSSGIPKSLVADIKRLSGRLSSVERGHASLMKEVKSGMKSAMDMMKKHDSMIKSHDAMMKKQDQTISQLGKKAVKKAKRKPSAYNLFLKDKMSQGMTMVDAVKAWKEKEAGMPSSSMRETGQEWQSTTTQY